MHSRSATDADVTEGPGGVWERLHYDWSDPTRIVITDTDSNARGGRSGYLYTLTARPDGRTDIDEVVTRDGKNLKGRIIGFGLGTASASTPSKRPDRHRQGHRSPHHHRSRGRLTHATTQPPAAASRTYAFGVRRLLLQCSRRMKPTSGHDVAWCYWASQLTTQPGWRSPPAGNAWTSASAMCRARCAYPYEV